MSEKILEVKDLEVQFKTEYGLITAVNGISFDVYRGKTFGIVGESGSGKSVSVLSIMGLIPNPPGIIKNGSIKFGDRDLLTLNEDQMSTIRGNKISMIFQEPMTSLNPVFTVGNQIKEVFKLHQKDIPASEVEVNIIDLFKLVGIPAPEKRIKEYPYQLSGGMRQRVMIAMALACRPDILIADEPTTALDVTIQAQILELMNKIKDELNMSIILITHDLSVVAEMCDSVAVMYCGNIVETSDIKTLFSNQKHPYTRGLIESIPSIKQHKNDRLKTIAGSVPSLHALPDGCYFQNRCEYASEKCKGSDGSPKLELVNKNHYVSCFHPLEDQI